MAKRHPGTIERRGNALRVTVYAAGKRHRFTLPTLDQREAKEFAKVKAAELEGLAKRWKRRGLGPVRMSVLLDRFEAERLPLKAPNTQTTYQASLGGFRTYFVEQLGDPLVHEVESDLIAEFLAWRRGQRRHGRVTQEQAAKRSLPPVTNRTLAKERTTLHAVFAFAEELRLRDANPVDRTDAPKADPRTPVILTDAQFEKLVREMAAVSPMRELYALLLGETGGRCDSEALWLRWEDVDLEQGFLAIVSGRDGNRTKSGRTRYVPLTPRLQKALAAHMLRFKGATYNGQPSPWVFHHLTTRRHAVAGERILSLYGAFKGAARRAGLPADLHQHDLRHRRVTTWIAQGKDVVLVKEALGHADLRTTMGYTHLAKEHLRALVEPAQARAPALEGSA
jgi:integrase/recombinase XerD